MPSRLGRLEFARSPAGVRSFRVRCALSDRVERGYAAPRYAGRLLRGARWDYLPRLGWVSPEGLASLRRGVPDA